MNSITLTKHHGLGNDFLVTFDEVDDPAEFARWVCDRKRGFGADGLIVGLDSDDQRIACRMLLHNADGSRAEISGNGIRCFAQALHMRSGVTSELLIATDAGERAVTLGEAFDAATMWVTVDMGEVADLDEPDGWERTECNPDRPVAHLSLGNPHSVVGVEDVDVVELADIGRRVPQVNLEIVAPTARPDTVRMRVHERGVGITEACGSGALAAAYAANRWGLARPTEQRVHVDMDGGRATVILDQPTPGRVSLVGPTTYVGEAEVPLDVVRVST